MTKHTETGRTGALPALFEPKWICAASLIFTPLYGAYLQARNWDALNEPDEARASRLWGRSTLWLIGLFLVMQTLFRNEPVMAYSGPYFLAVLWCAWMLTSGLRQIRHMREKSPAYERLPFGKTMTMGVLGWVLYGMVASTISLALVLLGYETLDEPKAPETGVVVTIPEGGTEATVREMTPEESDRAAKVTEELSEKGGIGSVRVAPDFEAKAGKAQTSP